MFTRLSIAVLCLIVKMGSNEISINSGMEKKLNTSCCVSVEKCRFIGTGMKESRDTLLP